MVFQLYTTGYDGREVFIGTFSNIEKVKERARDMCLNRYTWAEFDFIDSPVSESNKIWEINIGL
jgi:hypothetical protein